MNPILSRVLSLPQSITKKRVKTQILWLKLKFGQMKKYFFSGCCKPAPCYEQSSKKRRFDFFPIFGFLGIFLYALRPEIAPVGELQSINSHGQTKQVVITKPYQIFLEYWVKKLSLKDTAEGVVYS